MPNYHSMSMIQFSITSSKKEKIKIDEIIQKMRDLEIKFTKLKEKGQTSRVLIKPKS